MESRVSGKKHSLLGRIRGKNPPSSRSNVWDVIYEAKICHWIRDYMSFWAIITLEADIYALLNITVSYLRLAIQNHR